MLRPENSAALTLTRRAFQLPHFLKLLDMGVYTMVHPLYAADDYDAWVAKFMAGNRKERVENDIPYVNMDWDLFAEKEA